LKGRLELGMVKLRWREGKLAFFFLLCFGCLGAYGIHREERVKTEDSMDIDDGEGGDTEVEDNDDDDEGEDDTDEDEEMAEENPNLSSAPTTPQSTPNKPKHKKKKKKQKKNSKSLNSRRKSSLNLESLKTLTNEQAALAALESNQILHLRLRKKYYAEGLNFIRMVEGAMCVFLSPFFFASLPSCRLLLLLFCEGVCMFC